LARGQEGIFVKREEEFGKVFSSSRETQIEVPQNEVTIKGKKRRGRGGRGGNVARSEKKRGGPFGNKSHGGNEGYRTFKKVSEGKTVKG